MESWIKENQVTSILIGAVILLVLFSGYQASQISELHADQTEVRDYLNNDQYQFLVDTTASIQVLEEEVADLEFVTACDIYSAANKYIHPYQLSNVTRTNFIGTPFGGSDFPHIYKWSCREEGLQANNRFTTATGDKWQGILCEEVMSPEVKYAYTQFAITRTYHVPSHVERFSTCYALEQSQ
tara:strand:+ start:618 stop:1166 length:549 start_codon:yes stop_codon:yes gene_type:complete